MLLIIKTQEAGSRDEDCELYHTEGNTNANQEEGELFFFFSPLFTSNSEMHMGDNQKNFSILGEKKILMSQGINNTNDYLRQQFCKI